MHLVISNKQHFFFPGALLHLVEVCLTAVFQPPPAFSSFWQILQFPFTSVTDFCYLEIAPEFSPVSYRSKPSIQCFPIQKKGVDLHPNIKLLHHTFFCVMFQVKIELSNSKRKFIPHTLRPQKLKFGPLHCYSIEALHTPPFHLFVTQKGRILGKDKGYYRLGLRNGRR